MITMQVEKLSNVKDEVYPLLIKHWEEIALNKATVPLDPNWELYQRLEDLELLVITTGRDDGKIVGYFCFILAANLHYRSLKIAEIDIFYVDKEYRKGRFALNLLKEAEKNVIAAGANKIITKTKDHFRNENGVKAGKLFEYMGYVMIESVYAKMVK